MMKLPLIVYFLVAILLTLPDGVSGKEPTLIIEGARILVGDGTVFERASVVIAGEWVVEVTEDAVQAPDVRRIDAAGKTVLPGLIDTHVHLLTDPEDHPFNPEASAPDPTARFHGSDAAFYQFRKQVLPRLLHRYLAAGFTTVFSAGDFWPMIAEVRDEIERSTFDGPRLMISGPLFTAPDGHPAATLCGGDAWCRAHLVREVDDPRIAEDLVANLAENGVDAFKVVHDSYDDHLPQLAPDVLEAITARANAMGIPVVAHLYSPEDVGLALERSVDAFVHMPALVSAESERKTTALDAVISDQTPISTTLGVADLVADAYERSGRPGVELMRERARTRSESLRVLLAESAQDQVAFGTDTQGLQPADSRDREIRYLSEAGMSNEQIIASLTGNAAAFLGRADELGTLKPGKLADLIVVDGNPLEDLSILGSIELVVQGGEIVVQEDKETGRSPRYTQTARN